MNTSSFEPMIIAHRGNSEFAPENTCASVISAWEAGADAVEIDVQVSCDNSLMVIHDENTQRTTGENIIIRNAPAEKIHNLDAGSHKDRLYAGEPIPYLSEILEILPPEKYLYIEWKASPGLIFHLAQLLCQYDSHSNIRLIALHPGSLIHFRNYFPQSKVYWIISNIQPEEYTKRILQHIKAFCLRHTFNGVDLYHELLSPDTIAMFHQHDLEVLTWTVNSSLQAQKYSDWGVDGITTDIPYIIKKKVSFS